MTVADIVGESRTSVVPKCRRTCREHANVQRHPPTSNFRLNCCGLEINRSNVNQGGFIDVSLLPSPPCQLCVFNRQSTHCSVCTALNVDALHVYHGISGTRDVSVPNYLQRQTEIGNELPTRSVEWNCSNAATTNFTWKIDFRWGLIVISPTSNQTRTALIQKISAYKDFRWDRFVRDMTLKLRGKTFKHQRTTFNYYKLKHQSR